MKVQWQVTGSSIRQSFKPPIFEVSGLQSLASVAHGGDISKWCLHLLYAGARYPQVRFLLEKYWG